MTAQMKSKDVRRRASTDLHEEIKRLQKAVFDQRFRGQSEEKSDRGLVRRSRRDVARILTVLRERELAEKQTTAAVVPTKKPAVKQAAVKLPASKKPAAKKPAVTNASGGKKKE